MRPTSPSRQSHPETGATPLFARRSAACPACLAVELRVCFLFKKALIGSNHTPAFDTIFFDSCVLAHLSRSRLWWDLWISTGHESSYWSFGRFSFLKNLRTWSCDTKVFHERRLFLLPPWPSFTKLLPTHSISMLLSYRPTMPSSTLLMPRST